MGIDLLSNHPYVKNLVGQKFGKLTVESFAGVKGKGQSKHSCWHCICNCGNQKIIMGCSLTGGKTNSCGCLDFGNKNCRWSGFGEISGTYWNVLRGNAKNRNIEFVITIEEAWNLFLKQERKCALTGQILNFKIKSKFSEGTASLDRIDSGRGYIEGNVQWVHKDVNYMKNNMSDKELIDWSIKIVNYQFSKNFRD